jgi:hypothetical protein
MWQSQGPAAYDARPQALRPSRRRCRACNSEVPKPNQILKANAPRCSPALNDFPAEGNCQISKLDGCLFALTRRFPKLLHLGGLQ